MQAFSFPFRFVKGRAPSIDTTTDQYAAQIISSIIQTEIEELPITPSFGTDPAEFDQFDIANLTLDIARYFPQIDLESITEVIEEDGTFSVQVSFKQNSYQ
jgi:hypothetical protein